MVELRKRRRRKRDKDVQIWDLRFGIWDFLHSYTFPFFIPFVGEKTAKSWFYFGVAASGISYIVLVTKNELQERTKRFALNVLNYLDSLPRTSGNAIIINQLGRSSTSVPANYRAACRSRSRKEFISKIAIVEEESDESFFWLGFLLEKNGADETLHNLIREADELTAIFTAISKTTKNKLSQGMP